MPTDVRTKLAVLAEQLTYFHNREHEAQRKAVRDVWALPIEARVRKGSALAKVWVPEVKLMTWSYFASQIKVKLPVNNSNFKVGSFVLLHKGNPFDDKAYKLEIKEDLGKELVLSGDRPGSIVIKEASGDWIIDADIRDFRWILQKALDALLTAPTTGALVDILLHQAPLLSITQLVLPLQRWPYP
jgi:hypothetical protein